MEGYYSFGVICADSSGQEADSFFTLNIQPLTFFSNWAPVLMRPLFEVPVRDYYFTKQAIEVQTDS